MMPPTDLDEAYRENVHRQGLGQVRQLLVAGSPARAFAAAAVMTETEARIVGVPDVSIPTRDGMQRLIRLRRGRADRGAA